MERSELAVLDTEPQGVGESQNEKDREIRPAPLIVPVSTYAEVHPGSRGGVVVALTAALHVKVYVPFVDLDDLESSLRGAEGDIDFLGPKFVEGVKTPRSKEGSREQG